MTITIPPSINLYSFLSSHHFSNLNLKNVNLSTCDFNLLSSCTHLNLINTNIHIEQLLLLIGQYQEIILDVTILLKLYDYNEDRLTIKNPQLINAVTSLGDTVLILLLKEDSVLREECQEVINMGVHINHVNHAGYDALYYCIKNHHNEVVYDLLEKGVCVNTIYKYYSSILYKCLYYNNIHFIKTFIDFGANIHQINVRGDTLLIYAVDYGSYHIANLLIQLGLDIHHVNYFDIDALKCAVIRHHIPMINTLLSLGADPTKGVDQLALLLAAKKGYIDIIYLLYDYISNKNDSCDFLNGVNKKGNTALLMALKYNQFDVAKHLIDLGADIHVINKKGENVVYMYLLYNQANREQLNYFKQQGVHFNDINTYTGQNLLLLAIILKCSSDVILFLLNEVDIHYINYDGENALTIALMIYQNLELIQLLVQHGIDLNHGQPLITAIEHQCSPKIILYLLQCQINVNQIKDEQHLLCWMIKSNTNYLECIEWILTHNTIHLNVLNEAFILSFMLTKMTINKLLITYINIKNLDLLKLAIDTVDYDVVDHLIQLGADVQQCPLRYIIDAYQDYRHLGLLYLLILNKKDMDEKVNDMSLLMYCIKNNKDKNIIHFLIDCGINIHFMVNNMSALSYCLIYNHDMDMILKLVKLGANTNIINSNQWREFCQNAKKDYKHEVDELLTYLNVNYI
jgi:ankyrin repeat protein